MWFEVQKKSESIRVSFRVVDNDHDLYIIGAVCVSVCLSVCHKSHYFVFKGFGRFTRL